MGYIADVCYSWDAYVAFCPDFAVTAIHVEIIQAFSHLLCLVYFAYLVYTPNLLFTAIDRAQPSTLTAFWMEWSYMNGQLVWT